MQIQPAYKEFEHSLSQILYLLSAAFFYEHDERREQQPVLNLSDSTVVAIRGLTF